MDYPVALDYILNKNISPTYISNNSSISFSTARRLVKSKDKPFTPQTETKLALIEFVKGYMKSYDTGSNADYIDRLVEQVDEHFNELLKRPSFRKTLNIYALKIFIKAQSFSDKETIDIDVLDKVIKSLD